MIDEYWHDSGFGGRIVRTTLRTLQFAFAIVILGLYGADLSHASKNGARANTNWVYAVVVACLAALTCIVHCFVTVKRVAWAAWDWVLLVLWAAAFGVFARMYVGARNTRDAADTTSVQRMKIAVWIVMVNMILWFASVVHAVAWCIGARRLTRKTNKPEPSRVEQGQAQPEEVENASQVRV
ncbi:hypothetical protein H2201_006015 [Coniosporium apollinis]|uniref:MARVEL domain-containing protein n=2 Tax=Coniosporium TaxID=2810619 RepID=A0ABQ9NN19_9PEZI|nr:hypothetical protein H2199_002955 [Cladosporium sp. JES 115]KAJ9662527.1 hypothetical protein H2201_006015 [Coniosporium apollinis]